MLLLSLLLLRLVANNEEASSRTETLARRAKKVVPGRGEKEEQLKRCQEILLREKERDKTVSIL